MTKPRIRYFPLPTNAGLERTLVQLDVPPLKRAIAIILDMSDSNTQVREVSRQLPKLLTRISREIPLHVLRISCGEALNFRANHNVGHLVDESISLLNWLDSRTEVELAANCGSFLRPAIEFLNNLSSETDVQEILTVVVTDGKLSDREPVEILPKIQLVGLGPTQEHCNQHHWQRVSTKRPFLSFDDRRLDTSYLQFLSHSPRSFEIEVNHKRHKKIYVDYYDDKSNNMIAFSKPTWDSGEPITLMLTSDEAVISDIAVRLTSVDQSYNYQLFLSDAEELSDQEISQFKNHVSLNDQDMASSCVLDIDASKVNLEDLRRIIDEIEMLAGTRAKWNVKNYQSSPLLSMLSTKIPEIQSVESLVFFANEPSSEETLRLVAFSLRRSNSPAIDWSTGTSTLFGIPAKPIKISYHRMEGRWQCLVMGEETIELDPNGSQFLGEVIFGSRPWKCYSSGPLQFDF